MIRPILIELESDRVILRNLNTVVQELPCKLIFDLRTKATPIE